MIRVLLLSLVSLAGWLAAADSGTLSLIEHNGWTVSLDDRRLVFARGGQAVGTAWLFQCRFSPWTRAADGSWSSTSRQGGKDMAQVTVALDPAGRLRLACAAPAAGLSGKGPTLLVGMPPTFAAGGLAIDGAPFAIPATPDEQRRAWGVRKNAVLFAGQEGRRLGLAVLAAKDASVRDQRGGRESIDMGSFDFVFYLHPTADGSGVVEFDLAQAGAATTEGLGVRVGGRDPSIPVRAAGANLIVNPGFAAGLTGWGRLSVGNSAADPWSLDPAGGSEGGAAAVYTQRKDTAQAMLASQAVVVEPGRDYTLSFSVRASAPKTAVFAFAQTAVWPTFPAKKWVKAGPDWQRHALTFKAPNRFVRLCLGDHWNSNLPTADGVQVWIDDVQLVAGTEPGAFTQDPVVCHTATPVRDGVFLAGQAAPLRVVLTNTTAQPQPCTATVEVRDAFRTVLATRTMKAELPPRGTAEEVIDLAATGATGLFSIRVHTAGTGFSGESFGRAAILAPIASVPRVRYLFYQRPPSADEAAWRLRLGYGGALSWDPPTPAQVASYAKLGWRQIFSPTEAADAPVKLFEQAMAAADWTRYFAWLDARTAPFAGQPVWCKTMNEPDIARRTWTPEEHLGIVRHLRGTLGATPGTVLLTPEPVTTNRHGLDWLDRFLGLGGKDVVDAIGTHTYRARPESPDLDADIQLIRALKAKHGIAKKPIYFSEGEGYVPYTIPEHGISPFTGFADWRLGLLSLDVGPSETAVAGLMARTLLVCLKNADDVATYTTWGDDLEAGQPLASLAAVNHLFSVLGAAEFTCERTLGDAARAYQFQTARGPVAALWSYDLRVEQGEVPRPLASLDAQGTELRLTDLMGNPLKVERKDGRLVFPLGGHPVFLSGAMTPAKLTAVLESATVGGKGVRAVDATLRLAALDAATATVANLLPRPVAGRLTVTVDGAEAAAAEVTVAARGEASLAVPLRGATGKLNTARIELAFAGANGEATAVADDLRWFGIPALANSGDTWWEAVAPLRLDTAAAVVNGTTWGGPADLSVAWRLGWEGDSLRLHAEVTDDVLQEPSDIGSAWKADSLQIYLDLYGDGHRKAAAGYDSNDTSLVVAKVGGKDVVWRDLAPEWQVGFVKGGAVEGAQVRITRRDAVTVYDLRLPAAAIFPIALKPGSAFGCALLVNDGDAPGVRKQSMSMTRPGSEPHLHPELWPHAVLSGR